MLVFDKLINLIYSKKIEVTIKVNSKKIFEFIPKIYYIGGGKTGSSSIVNGFSNVNTAHWHGVSYFEQIYKTKLLSSNNYDLYDLIIYIGNKYNFKPVIIESIRNPINVGISSIFQFMKINLKVHNNINNIVNQITKYKSDNNINGIIEIIKKYISDIEIDDMPYSCEIFKKHFNINLLSSFDKDLNYYFNNINNVYLLVLKFEDIKNWSDIINNNLPYKFVLEHVNKENDEFYKIVKTNLKFTKKEIQPLLNCRKMTFYSNAEIDKISTEFILN